MYIYIYIEREMLQKETWENATQSENHHWPNYTSVTSPRAASTTDQTYNEGWLILHLGLPTPHFQTSFASSHPAPPSHPHARSRHPPRLGGLFSPPGVQAITGEQVSLGPLAIFRLPGPERSHRSPGATKVAGNEDRDGFF